MTDYAAEAPTLGFVTPTQRSGTASADTVPAGAVVLFQNTGAGTHNIDLAQNALYEGLQTGTAGGGLGKRRVTITTGAFALGRISANAGDASGRVGLTIDGTAAEVKYWVIGA